MTEKGFPVSRAIGILKKEVKKFRQPIVGIYAREGSPFKVLVSTLLSLRTKDAVTLEASERLFKLADTPEKLRALPENKIARAIYPVGFYKNKARSLKELAATLVDEHGGRVPDDLDELLKLKGVGRKTANLTVTMAYGKPGICVDIHVHRITNRWGYVKTKTPDETEMALREKLPQKHWIEINDLLVAYGQNICVPVSPRCSECRLSSFCPRTGVTRSR